MAVNRGKAIVRTVIRALGAVVTTVLLFGASSPAALAFDLSGKTLTAEGRHLTVRPNSVREDTLWTLEIYFGTKGNRFVQFEKTIAGSHVRTSDNRVIIEAGKDSGSKRRKDTNFTLIVSLTPTTNGLQVRLESRGKDLGYANENFIYEIALGGNTCRVTNYRYLPDARLNLRSVKWTDSDCKIMEGPPADLGNTN